MIFTLEALQADHGDCLLLHYGKTDDPKTIVIDGGPSGIYRNFLKPRLLQVKAANSPNAPLSLSMVMVSHMDDDHVNGILSLTKEAIDLNDAGKPMLFEMDNLWFNAFDDIIGNKGVPGIASIASTASVADINGQPFVEGLDREVTAVVASTGQGRTLRENAKLLQATVNNSFEALNGKANLVRGDGKKSAIKWDTGLTITVIHPNAQRLEELQTQWDNDLKKIKAGGKDAAKIIAASLGNTDKSPFNLSSIVCLVEFGGKKILLTGDARSDDIVKGLEQNKLMDSKGKIHVDILKMNHHFSARDLSLDYFEKVTADNYVVSANGKFSNPDKESLDAFVDSTPKTGKIRTLFLTNKTGLLKLGPKITATEKRIQKAGCKLKLAFRDPKALSLKIDLLDKVKF
jgi:hypothetical protein